MPKSPDKDPAEQAVEPVGFPASEQTAPDVEAPPAVPVEPVEADAPPVEPVKVVLDPDFEADGDVYVSVASIPEEFRVSKDDDRYKVPSNAAEVPPEVAAVLLDSAAVTTPDQIKAREEAAE